MEGMSAANLVGRTPDRRSTRPNFLAVEGAEGIRARRGQRHTNPVTFGVDGARWDVRGSHAKQGGNRSTNRRCKVSDLRLMVTGGLWRGKLSGTIRS